MNIFIPMNNIQEKLTWTFSSIGKLFVKAATWTNNDQILSHPRAKLLYLFGD